MENVIIRNIEEKDIPSVVDIQISGWQIKELLMIVF